MLIITLLYVKAGIRAIAPQWKLPPRLGLWFGLGLVLGLGAIFLGDNCPRIVKTDWKKDVSRKDLLYLSNARHRKTFTFATVFSFQNPASKVKRPVFRIQRSDPNDKSPAPRVQRLEFWVQSPAYRVQLSTLAYHFTIHQKCCLQCILMHITPSFLPDFSCT